MRAHLKVLATIGLAVAALPAPDARGQLPDPAPGSALAPGAVGIVIRVLGTLPGGTSATALDINNRGLVVGYGTDSNSQGLPVVWRNGRAYALPTLGGPSGRAASVNDRGDIVGTSWDQTNFNVATRWRKNRVFDLGALPWGPRRSHALSINDHRDIAGASMTQDSPKVSTLHLVRWPGGGAIEDLLPMANYLIAGTHPLPLGINDDGVIAGTRGGTTPPLVFPQRAFRWENGVVTDLLSLTGEIGGTLAFSVNTAGDVAGSSQTAAITTHAVMWRDGVPSDLGALPNFNDFSMAYAIADDGAVAGYSLEQNGQPMAVLWRGGDLIRLGNPPGYFASKAYGINDLGQIVGEATQSSTFRVHAVVWIVE